MGLKSPKVVGRITPGGVRLPAKPSAFERIASPAIEGTLLVVVLNVFITYSVSKTYL